jgi:hypothetical protein
VASKQNKDPEAAAPLWFAKTLADFEINDVPCRSQKLRDPEFRPRNNVTSLFPLLIISNAF